MKLLYIKHIDIDKKKYDQCIWNANYGTIYAMSWYLDIVAPEWSLITTPDYEYVMPVPNKKKYGIPYAMQPLMCQQLGIFSSGEITKKLFQEFMKKIPAWYCLLQFNPSNSFNLKELSQRPNYVLDLHPEYEEIKSRYHHNTLSDLKKATKEGFETDHRLELSEFWQIVEKNSKHYTGKLLEAAKKVAAQAAEKESFTIRCVRAKETSEILAVALFFFWKNRIYYLVNIITPQGKKVRAMRFLLDRFIAEFAGKDYTLDFEGSSVPSVAQFYQNIGGVFESYLRYYKNKFPYPLSLIKTVK